MKPFSKFALFLLGASFLFASCSQKEMEDVINDILAPVTIEPGSEVPEGAAVYINGTKMDWPSEAIGQIPPDMIESISLIRPSSDFPAEVHLQMKKGSGSFKIRKVEMDTIQRVTPPANLGEMIAQMVNMDNSILEYDFFINGQKAALAEIKGYSYSVIVSIRNDFQGKKIHIIANPTGNNHYHTSVKQVMEYQDAVDLSQYTLYKNDEPITLDALNGFLITDVVRIEHDKEEKILKIYDRSTMRLPKNPYDEEFIRSQQR